MTVEDLLGEGQALAFQDTADFGVLVVELLVRWGEEGGCRVVSRGCDSADVLGLECPLRGHISARMVLVKTRAVYGTLRALPDRLASSIDLMLVSGAGGRHLAGWFGGEGKKCLVAPSRRTGCRPSHQRLRFTDPAPQMSPNPGQNGAHIGVHSSANGATGNVISSLNRGGLSHLSVWSNCIASCMSVSRKYWREVQVNPQTGSSRPTFLPNGSR